MTSLDWENYLSHWLCSVGGPGKEKERFTHAAQFFVGWYRRHRPLPLVQNKYLICSGSKSTRRLIIFNVFIFTAPLDAPFVAQFRNKNVRCVALRSFILTVGCVFGPPTDRK
jgi:hypothetical protein